MESQTAYCSKAEKYAKYRWDYAPEAIEAIKKTTGISPESAIADIGAGTGILSQHFVEMVKHVFAVEINPDMRSQAECMLAKYPAFQSIDGCAEATGLPDHSIDLITVAQAIHWFEPEPTKREFLRILKPTGWLAILRNYSLDDEIHEAMRSVFVEKNGAIPPQDVIRPEHKPLTFYYSHTQFQTHTYTFTNTLTSEAFLGSALSASYAPSEDHPRYPAFERAVHHVFDQFSTNGYLTTHGATELCMGQMFNDSNGV
jgi:ubiquinone/menaquinone biosynthesis C-methylase UbiE